MKPMPGPDEALSADDDPILGIFADMVERLERLAAEPDAVLTCQGLLGVFGVRSHTLALLIFSLLNLLPGPPGYNFLMAVITTTIAVKMLLGRQIGLWGPIGRMRVPIGLIIRLSGMLSRLAGQVARISRPRLTGLTGPAVQKPLAAFGLVLGLAQLPPIPFANLLPALGQAIISTGQLNRDGAVVIAGVLVGLVGLAVLAVAIWAILALVWVVDAVID